MLNAIAKFLDKPDLGFLIMRVVAGVIFIGAGVGKFMGGQSALEHAGSAMAIFGLGAPMFWGLLAALAETVGGLLLIIGFLFRGAALFLTGTMLVATIVKVQGASGFDLQAFGFPLIMLAISAGLMLTGPGKFAVQKGGA